MNNGFKVETSTHILTYYEGMVIIEDKEDLEGEPLIVEIKDLSKIQVSTLNSIYPIVEWLVKEIKPKKRKYTKRKKDEK
jgi:hypothetical protein